MNTLHATTISKPGVRLFDTSNHVWQPAEFDGDVPPFDPLGAALAIAFAAGCEAGSGVTRPGTTLLATPCESQRRLHTTLIADLNLGCQTATLQGSAQQRADRLVLDLPWQATCPDVPGNPASFHFGANLIDAAFAAARHEVIVLGNACELTSARLASGAVSRRVAALEQTRAGCEDLPRRLLSPARELHTPGLGFYLQLKQAHRMIHRDVAAARKRVVWNLPERCREDSQFIPRRPNMEQVLIQPVSPRVARHYEFLGYRVFNHSRAESIVFVDDELLWLVGSPRMGEFVRPLVRVRGRRITRLLTELYGLNRFFPARPAP